MIMDQNQPASTHFICFDCNDVVHMSRNCPCTQKIYAAEMTEIKPLPPMQGPTVNIGGKTNKTSVEIPVTLENPTNGQQKLGSALVDSGCSASNID
jgi:hypothetical protein